MAVPPELVGFVESVGVECTGFALKTQPLLDVYNDFWACLLRKPWRVGDLSRLRSEYLAIIAECWDNVGATVTSLSNDADLLLVGLPFHEATANVAEYYDIPFATLHWFPARANGQLMTFVPARLGRFLMAVADFMNWRLTRKLDNRQRRELGLTKATYPSPRRIAERGSLEIQAYEELCFPGLASEWAEWNGHRPFVGALTIEMPTDADDEVASWIAAGEPPIFFGFGSMEVKSAADTFAMMEAACAKLGQRALICSGVSEFGHFADGERVKVVAATNYAAAFPSCRTVVHHGGAGTIAAGLRAGVPQLILPMDTVQPFWGAQVERLKVGLARRFSSITEESLVADLRTLLDPQYQARAREIACRMSTPTQSVVAAADHVDSYARLRRVLTDR